MAHHVVIILSMKTLDNGIINIAYDGNSAGSRKDTNRLLAAQATCDTSDSLNKHHNIDYYNDPHSTVVATQPLYNIYTMLDQRRRRWANVV